MADIGIWTVTLSVSLQLYPAIPASTSTVTVTVTDPCLTTVIQPELIADMSISIYDVLPAT